MKAQDREDWLQRVIDLGKDQGAVTFKVIKTRDQVLLEGHDADGKMASRHPLHRIRRNSGDTEASMAFRLRRKVTEYTHWVHLLTEVRP